jgi:NADPH:quinone reductase-like Zn-dependent oxidoreductase
MVYASLGGQSLQPGLANLMFRDVRLHGFWLSNWLDRLTPEQLKEFSSAVMKLLAIGVIQTLPADVFPLARVEEAILQSQVPNEISFILGHFLP